MLCVRIKSILYHISYHIFRILVVTIQLYTVPCLHFKINLIPTHQNHSAITLTLLITVIHDNTLVYLSFSKIQ